MGERDGRSRGRHRALVALGAVAVAGLTACTPSVEAERMEAYDTLDRLLRTTAMNSHTTEIDEYARVAADAPGLELIAIGRPDGAEGDAQGDVVGTLTFWVVNPVNPDPGPFMPPQSERKRGPYCFEVVFGRWGVLEQPGTPSVTYPDCPPDAAPVTPPASTDPVVAPDAREAAHEVLAELTTSRLPSADEIARRVTARLEPSPGDGPPVAEATAVVDGGRVGVAMGDADDCVLVAWSDGEVHDIHPPSIKLRQGELGCRPGTALSDDLAPPH